MTFHVKTRGDSTRPILAEYTCPVHGTFDELVQRDDNGEAPDVVRCRVALAVMVNPDPGGVSEALDVCGLSATWTPSPVVGRVKQWEVVRGGWQKPERPTFLDTRDLGEGQDEEEFRAKRAKVWEERRHAEIKEQMG